MSVQAAEAGLTMAAVLRHLVSGAALTVGLPPLPPMEDNGSLPGSVGGIPRPALATLSDSEWAALAGDDAAEDDDEQAVVAEAEEEDEEDVEDDEDGEVVGYEDVDYEAVDFEDMATAAVDRIPDDMLLGWEDLKDLPVNPPHRDCPPLLTIVRRPDLMGQIANMCH